jgi:UPF0042 nucleotide-binding protein
MTHAAIRPAARPAGAVATDEATAGRLPVLLITGLSGAGHSTALKLLEDIGYEAVDNVPLALLSGLTRTGNGLERPLAICVDSRTRDFTPELLIERLERLSADPGLAVKLVFLDCSDEILRRRFTETRRRHPLALDRPVDDGIRRERLLLMPLLERADIVIDTSDCSIADLRRRLQGEFTLERPAGVTVVVTSFAYRYGLPREADLVFDVRFLENPHYVDALRPLTGKSDAVAQFLEADPAFDPFFAALTNLLEPLLPRFEREGKSYLTIAVGCTGGRHRSVYVAERLTAWLRGQGKLVSLRHRDLSRGAGRDHSG